MPDPINDNEDDVGLEFDPNPRRPRNYLKILALLVLVLGLGSGLTRCVRAAFETGAAVERSAP